MRSQHIQGWTGALKWALGITETEENKLIEKLMEEKKKKKK